MTVYNSEKVRFVHHMRVVTFCEAKEAGADFISRSLISARIQRSQTLFVEDNLKKNPYVNFRMLCLRFPVSCVKIGLDWEENSPVALTDFRSRTLLSRRTMKYR